MSILVTKRNSELAKREAREIEWTAVVHISWEMLGGCDIDLLYSDTSLTACETDYSLVSH